MQCYGRETGSHGDNCTEQLAFTRVMFARDILKRKQIFLWDRHVHRLNTLLTCYDEKVHAISRLSKIKNKYSELQGFSWRGAGLWRVTIHSCENNCPHTLKAVSFPQKYLQRERGGTGHSCMSTWERFYIGAFVKQLITNTLCDNK